MDGNNGDTAPNAVRQNAKIFTAQLLRLRISVVMGWAGRSRMATFASGIIPQLLLVELQYAPVHVTRSVPLRSIHSL